MEFIPLNELLDLEKKEDEKSSIDTKLQNLKNQNTIEIKLNTSELPVESSSEGQNSSSDSFEDITISIRRDDDYVMSALIPVSFITPTNVVNSTINGGNNNNNNNNYNSNYCNKDLTDASFSSSIMKSTGGKSSQVAGDPRNSSLNSKTSLMESLANLQMDEFKPLAPGGNNSQKISGEDILNILVNEVEGGNDTQLLRNPVQSVSIKQLATLDARDIQKNNINNDFSPIKQRKNFINPIRNSFSNEVQFEHIVHQIYTNKQQNHSFSTNENECSLVEDMIKKTRENTDKGKCIPEELYINNPFSLSLSSKGGSLTSDSLISAMKLRNTNENCSNNENTAENLIVFQSTKSKVASPMPAPFISNVSCTKNQNCKSPDTFSKMPWLGGNQQLSCCETSIKGSSKFSDIFNNSTTTATNDYTPQTGRFTPLKQQQCTGDSSIPLQLQGIGSSGEHTYNSFNQYNNNNSNIANSSSFLVVCDKCGNKMAVTSNLSCSGLYSSYNNKGATLSTFSSISSNTAYGVNSMIPPCNTNSSSISINATTNQQQTIINNNNLCENEDINFFSVFPKVVQIVAKEIGENLSATKERFLKTTFSNFLTELCNTLQTPEIKSNELYIN